jgi:tetratricopeptide (TPR) repeat protein
MLYSFARVGAVARLRVREPAELALAILGVLDGSWGGMVEQVKARAWGALANVHRLNGDFNRAEEAFYRASFHLANAPDPLEEAHFYRLRARLRRDQGKLDVAIALQERAVRRLVRFAAPALGAEALLELAALHLTARDRPQTRAVLQAAVGMLRQKD